MISPLAALEQRREAVFTASPSTVYSSRCSLPMLPANTSPKLMPMPMLMAGLPVVFQCSFSSTRARCISIAAAIALSASSSVESGAPHSAMIASPMNLSSVPPLRNTISTISVKYSRSRCATSSGAIFSDIEVKPRMSVNMITTSRLLPMSSFIASPWPAICLARSGEK